MSLEKASKAGFSLLFRKIWDSILNLFVMAILARQLPLSDFGILAASMVVINWINTLTSAGLDDFVILYKGKEKEKMWQASFSISFWVSLSMLCILFLIAPFWSSFFSSKEVLNILYLLGIIFFFNALTVVPKAILRKQLAYTKIIKIQIIIGSIATIAKVFAVYMGWGVYSLVLPITIAAPIQAFFFFKLVDRKVFSSIFNIDLKLWKEAYTFTSYIIGSRLINRLMNEGDNLIVGKTLGLESLGLYNIAYQSANFVVAIITGIVGDVSTPIFSKVSHDMNRLKETVLRMLHLIGFISIPIIAIIIVFSDQMIWLLYGKSFMAAVIPLKLLAIFALFRMFNSPSSNIFNSLQMPKKPFYFQLIILPFFLVCIYLASFNGLIAFTASVVLIRCIFSFILIYQSLLIINIKIYEAWQAIKPYILSFTPIFILLLLLKLYSNGFTWQLYIGYSVCVLFSVYMYLFILKQTTPMIWQRTKDELKRIHPSLKLLDNI